MMPMKTILTDLMAIFYSLGTILLAKIFEAETLTIILSLSSILLILSRIIESLTSTYQKFKNGKNEKNERKIIP
jgi:hypothetical protein